MKRLLTLTLALLLALSLAACSTGESGDETTGEHEEYDPAWHLSETLSGVDLLVEYENGIIFPYTEFEKSINQFLFKIEFFEEFYPIGSMMQYRLSVTNNTGEDVVYDAGATLGEIRLEDQGYPLSGPKPVLRSVSFEPISHRDVSYDTDGEEERVFPAGETLVFERAIRVDPAFFTLNKYNFVFLLRRNYGVTVEYATFEYPIYVVDYETVKLDVEPYTPEWHLSETVEEDLLRRYDIGVVPPLTEEKTIDSLFFQIEFFEEFYPIGSQMQYRLSVTNNTGEDVTYDAVTTLGHLSYTDPKTLERRTLEFNAVNHRDVKYHNYTDMSMTVPRTLPAGETVVFERALRVDPGYFTVGSYTFCFFIAGKTLEIPISVIDRNN